MVATFEDGSNNSGDPDIHEDPPTEGRIFTSDEIARKSKYSLVHKLYATDPDVAGSKRCESDNMSMMDARIEVSGEMGTLKSDFLVPGISRPKIWALNIVTYYLPILRLILR